MASDNGELDNGQLEIKEDAFDRAVKNHHRLAPPAELLDRCCATIGPAESAAPEPSESTPALRLPNRSSRLPWVAMTAAACIIIGIGLVLLPPIQSARESASRTVARNNLKQIGPATGNYDQASPVSPDSDYAMSNGALPYLEGAKSEARPSESIADKFVGGVKETRDGTANTTVFGEVAGSDGVPAREGKRDKEMQDALRIVEESVARFEREAKKVTDLSIAEREASPAQSSAAGLLGAAQGRIERQVGRGTIGGGRGLPKNLEQLDSAQGLKAKAGGESLEKRVEELRSAVRRLTVNDLDDEVAQGVRGPNTEAYARVTDNAFLAVSKSPLSTFSIDVDTASYSNVRRFLNQGTLPPKDAVRIEEMLNYFTYNYAQPRGNDPFSVNLEVAGCPWNGEHRLVRVGLKGREVANDARPPANLVFLIDVSGSMQPHNKLPLLKSAMKLLTQRLGENERVAIITYSHEIKLVLPSTTCMSRETITAAIDSLQAAGSTNGAGGLQLAYSCAIENFIPGGINRVILATDGDFNVGITEPTELQRFIEQKAKSGVFLSVLGFGYGNLKDATLERLADKGNGHFAYIDNLDEAKKVLVDQLSGTLMTIAKDVKLQIEFNPTTVSAYRLIGYENRIMRDEDFNDDRKDAGDIGAGHTVTALYEIVPVGKSITPPGQPGIDPLKYQPPPRDELPAREKLEELERPLAGKVSREMLTVKLRYKQPDADQSKLLEVAVTDSGRRFGEATADYKFASAVAAFGMILRDSPHRGTATLDAVLELADDGRGTDREGYRAEFIKLVRLAKTMAGKQTGQ